MWEFGAGDGRITRALLSRHITKVVMFELDPVLVRTLHQQFYKEIKERRCDIIAGNMLNTLQDVTITPQAMIGNLPFASASVLLLRLITECNYVIPCFFIVQKELARRIVSLPRTKSFSSLTVLVQLVFKVKIIGDIKAHNFTPPPHVSAALVAFYPRLPARSKHWRCLLADICKICFSMRRRTIENNLKKHLCRKEERSRYIKAFVQAGVSLRQRAEELTVTQWEFVIDYLSVEFPTAS